VVVGPHHPWWGRETVSIAELNEQRFNMRQPSSQTRIWLDEMLQQYDIQPTVDAEFDNIESIKRAVSLGGCIAILPPYAVQQELELNTLHLVSVQDAALRRTLKLVWNTEKPFSPLVAAFLRHLADEHLPCLRDFVAAHFGA